MSACQRAPGAARGRGVELSIYPVRKPEDVGPALERSKAAGAEAVNFLASPLFSTLFRKANFAKALALGLPATHHWPEGGEGWCFCGLRPEPAESVPSVSEPASQSATRRRSRNCARRTAHENRARCQSKGGGATRHHCLSVISVARRRGDRMKRRVCSWHVSDMVRCPSMPCGL